MHKTKYAQNRKWVTDSTEFCKNQFTNNGALL